MKEGLLKPSKIVSLTEVPGLDQVAEEKDGGLRIGPMVTLAAVAEHRACATKAIRRWPMRCTVRRVRKSAMSRLWAAICCSGRAAGISARRPIRCLRKGGGHCFAITGENQYHAIFNNMPCAIVHPSTAATVLVALGAMIELTGPGGAARQILLEDFFVPPDRDLQRENDLKPQEIVTAIRLPKPPASLRMAHLKQGEKDSFDWPIADVAVALDLNEDGTCKRAAIILGAAAPVPHRTKAAGAALVGKRIDENTAAAAGRAVLEGAAPLSKNAYKLPLFETLVRRTILRAAAVGGPANSIH